LDNWHPAGYLLDRFGYRAIYDFGFSIDAKLLNIIRNGERFWPSARSEAIVEIQGSLPNIPFGGYDLPVWESRNGKYSCAETWEKLRSKHPVVPWWKPVWFSMAIPRHSFFLWLVFRYAVVAQHKMSAWGYSGPCICLFCYTAQESREHLLFRCSFSVVLVVGSGKLSWGDCFFDVPTNWDEVKDWGPKTLRGKSLKNCLGRLCFAAVVYHLWKQRNALLHGNNPRSEEDILAQIRWEVRARIMAQKHFQNSDLQMALVGKWNLFSCL